MTAEESERRVRLSKRLLDSLETTERRFVVWDSDLRGFGVRVEPSGRMTFIVRYRAGDGGRRAPQRQASVGVYGTLTPEMARMQAKALLSAAQLGDDPAKERREKRQGKTVADLAESYLTDYAESVGLRTSTIRDARSVLRQYAIPKLGPMPVSEVTIVDVRRAHKAAFDKGGRYQANRMLAFLSKMFSLAIEYGWRTDNPCRGVRKFPEDRRERFLDDIEVARFFAALEEYPDQSAANALRLLLLTGSRLNEVLKAPWAQFDLERSVWIKPSAHTKQKRAHRLELDGPVVDLLREMRKADPFGAFLFPGRNPKAPRTDLKRPWDWVKERADLKDIKLHDLRHTTASWMVSNGIPLAVIGRTLGHTQAATTQRYAHVADQAQRQALAKVGSLFGEAAQRPAAVVVEIGKK